MLDGTVISLLEVDATYVFQSKLGGNQGQTRPLEAITAFPYLGSMVTFNNINWTALYINLQNAYRQWVVVAKVLGKTGVPLKSWEMMYKAVVQAVLLYGIKIW